MSMNRLMGFEDRVFDPQWRNVLLSPLRPLRSYYQNWSATNLKLLHQMILIIFGGAWTDLGSTLLECFPKFLWAQLFSLTSSIQSYLFTQVIYLMYLLACIISLSKNLFGSLLQFVYSQPRKFPGRKLFGSQLITRLIPTIPLLLARK